MGNRKKKKQTVLITGIFNVLHPGHFRLFKFATELADKVVVGLVKQRSSGEDMAGDEERLQALKAISWVNDIILIDDVMQTIVDTKPEIVLKGSEFKHQYNPEAEVLEQWGGQLVFAAGESYLSSPSLNLQPRLGPSIPFPEEYHDYIRRHGINGETLSTAIARFNSKKVAVVGDIILDEYIDCDPVGLSREDPTIVVTPIESQRFVGGAAIVAMHTNSLGAEVDFYAISGDDENASWLREKMLEQSVNAKVYADASRPTTVKKRFRSQNKTLLRVNEYRNHPLASNIQDKIIDEFERCIEEYDLIVFSDFSYGFLTQETVQRLQSVARKASVPMVADSQTSSQRGDLSKFSGLMLTTPTELEARLAVDIESREVGLAKVIEEVSKQLQANNVIITLGADGALILDNENSKKPKLDSLSALNRNPADVAGAGDVLLVATAMSKIAGVDIWHSAILGMLASGIHIGKVGNTPVQIDSLLPYIQRLSEQ